MRASDRLAELLNDALKPDRPLSGSDLWRQRGDYRKARWDLACWGAYPRVNGLPRTLCSFDTMTACVRRGIEISEDGGYAIYEVFAK